MPVPCPHCAKEIADVVPQSVLNERLKSKDDLLKAANDALAVATPKAGGYDTMAAELTTARQKLATTVGEVSALRVGMEKKIHDPRIVASLATIHAAEMAGKPEAERVDFGAWVNGDGAAHPVVAMALQAATPSPVAPVAPAAQPAPAPTAGAAPVAPAAPAAPVAPATPAVQPPPSGNAGAQPAPTGGMTPAQLGAYLASPEYRGLPADKRREKLAEMQGKYKDPAPGQAPAGV